MRICDYFPALSTFEERVHHVADDRPRTDDRDLHHDVVKLFRLQARQARHLRAAFYLEHSDCVGLLQRGIHGRIVSRQVREINFFFVVIADEFDRVFQYGHHAEAEQIDFDDAHVGTVFLVPLHYHAAGHGGGLQGADGIEASLTDDHAAGVLAEVPREILHGQASLKIFADS